MDLGRIATDRLAVSPGFCAAVFGHALMLTFARCTLAAEPQKYSV